jgi:nicotinamidase-related amidase
MKIAGKSKDNLHGNVPDTSATALLLVDVINDFDFPQNEFLLTQLPILSTRLANLKNNCKRARIPCLYINDNKGKWRSDFPSILKRCLARDSLGRTFVNKLKPATDDYIIFKPKHSAFYATPLELILSHMRVTTVILAGITTNACVLDTAMELHMRDFTLLVPQDCTCALTPDDHRRSLQIIKNSFDAEIAKSAWLRMGKSKVTVHSSAS